MPNCPSQESRYKKNKGPWESKEKESNSTDVAGHIDNITTHPPFGLKTQNYGKEFGTKDVYGTQKTKYTVKGKAKLEAGKRFCKFIKGVRLPDGFGSNFKQKVTADDNNLTGMEISVSPYNDASVTSLWSTTQYLPKALQLYNRVLLILLAALCRIYEAGLLSEAKKQSIVGPIRTGGLFPLNVYMKKLKNYVRNKAKPEGSIAEGYVAEEALTFCLRYLKDDVETRFNRLGRNDDGLPESNSADYRYLARQPRGWKVVEHVYHRDMAESDQDVIHGSSSSNVTLSVELTNFEHTDLSINSESTEVDALPVNDDNANANEGNAEDDVYAHVLDDDDDVVVSDDDEVNPSTNVEEMACVFPRSHGGDAGGSPPRRPNRPVPAQCESSNLRIETGNASLRRAFRQNDQRPLTIGFDYGDLGTFHPTGDYSSMLNSLMGETVKYLPLACEWEEIPEAYKAHIFPTLESYFDLASWYNNQDKVVMGNNVYTVGDRVKLGLQLKLRILWRKNKQRIKADHFTRYGSAEEARNHLPPKKVWGDRTEDEWNNLVDWWSHPDRVARSLQNAANRAKNTILTHQGKKSFAQGRNEYKVQKGHYEDLIETWRKTHSRPETGEFKTEKNRKRYLDMKSMQDQVRADVIPYKTDQDILDEVVPSTNRQNMSGKGRKLPGGGSTSRRRGPQAFPDVISREEMDRILRQRDQEAELLRKQTAEAQQRAYLAALKADAAYQNSETMYGAIGEYFSNYAPNPTRPFMPPAFARPTMPQLSPEWAHLLNPPFPYNQPLQPSYAGPSQYTGPPGYTGPPRYTAPLQPLQPPYVGQFPFTPVNNNTFNNCYHPVMNSNLASTSNSQPELPRFITNPHNNDTRSVDELARDKAGEDNDVREDNQQSGGDYSEDEEGDNEEVQDESEESD
ncbi:acidic leucine-rich nuclear phosphoprotein 32 family member A [Tanacetum coccineum]